jgi:hypothetical protein
MNFMVGSNIILSFELVKRWSSLFDNVTTCFEFWGGSQLKEKSIKTTLLSQRVLTIRSVKKNNALKGSVQRKLRWV